MATANSGVPVKLILQSEGAEAVVASFNELANNLNRITDLANQAGTAADKLQANMGQVSGEAEAVSGENYDVLARAIDTVADNSVLAANGMASLSQNSSMVVAAPTAKLSQALAPVSTASHGASSALLGLADSAGDVSAASSEAAGNIIALSSSAKTLSSAADGAAGRVQRLNSAEAQGSSSATAAAAAHKGLDSAINALSPSLGNIIKNFQQQGLAITAISVSIGLLKNAYSAFADFVKDAAATNSAVEQAELHLRQMSGSAKQAADAVNAIWQRSESSGTKLADLAAAAEVTARAGGNFNELGRYIEETAVATGKSLPEVAGIITKAMSGSAEAVMQMRQQLNIGAEDLVSFGAMLDKQGQITAKNRQEQEALGNAVKQFIENNYFGSVDKQAATAAGAQDRLAASIDRFKAVYGRDFADILKGVRDAFADTIDMAIRFEPIISKAAKAIAAFSPQNWSLLAGYEIQKGITGIFHDLSHGVTEDEAWEQQRKQAQNARDRAAAREQMDQQRLQAEREADLAEKEKIAKQEKEILQKNIAEQERLRAQTAQQQKSLDLSILEEELRTLEQRKSAGGKVEDEILAKRKDIYQAKKDLINAECAAAIASGTEVATAEEFALKKIAALDEQYHQEELRRAKETADAKQRIEAEARKKREAEIEKQAQERVEYLRDQTPSASSKSPNEQLNALREQIKLYQRALVADKQLLKSEKAREAAQKDLNSLKEREVKLVEQIAEIQKQADEQNEQLAKDLLEEELSTLEQRKAAGENVEQAIAAKREEIHQAKLTQIEDERQEQIKAGVEVERAEEAARLKRAKLDEQEKRRKLSDIADIKKASEPSKPQSEAEKKEAEYNSIRKKNQAKGIMSLDDVLSEYNARDAAWKAKLAEPFGESSASKTLADSSAAAAASVSGLSDNAKTASESIKVLGMCAAATVGSANVTTGINADANKTGAASANSKAASEPAKATSATVQVTPANANDASKTSESSASGFMSVLSTLSAAVGSILGGFSSFESAVTSAASALETLASSAASAGSSVSAGYAASSALISGDFVSSPLAMPTPGGMGAVNPSVLGASSLQSGGGSTTNTTNNFYMDDTRVAQNVTAEQVMRGVESMMAKRDAWASMYAGPWR